MNPKLLTFPKVSDPRGNLTFLENDGQIPFKIERIFWTYDIPGGETRGGHAYRLQQEIIVALNGSFDVVVKKINGEIQTYHLNKCYNGIFLPPNTWRHIENYSTNAISLHLSDSLYNKTDYIFDFDFLIKDE
jgi:hypothetical protein